MMCFAAADGSWLKKVPQADRERVNPYAGKPDAVAAGENLFRNNCAKCHGENAEGKGSRPSLKSERLENATDGEIAWIIKNGRSLQGNAQLGRIAGAGALADRRLPAESESARRVARMPRRQVRNDAVAQDVSPLVCADGACGCGDRCRVRSFRAGSGRVN